MRPGLVQTGGFMNNNFIIESPKLQTLRLKYTSTLLTLIFWVLWFYLWVPLITLAGWWLQISFFEEEILIADGLDAFLEVLPIFIAITFTLSGTLALWAYYNFSRFKGLDRRKALPVVNNIDLIQFWGITEDQLNAAQMNKVSTMVFSGSAQVIVRKESMEPSKSPDND